MRILLAVPAGLLLAPAAAQAERLSYRFGPIQPGQNTIEIAGNELPPAVDGYITSF